MISLMACCRALKRYISTCFLSNSCKDRREVVFFSRLLTITLFSMGRYILGDMVIKQMEFEEMQNGVI